MIGAGFGNTDRLVPELPRLFRRCKQPGEEEIREADHLFCAPETGVEVQHTSFAGIGNNLLRLLEPRYIGVAEEIDRLLGVPDNKEAVRFRGGCADDGKDNIELGEVRVLELIDKDIPEPRHEMRRDKFTLLREESVGYGESDPRSRGRQETPSRPRQGLHTGRKPRRDRAGTGPTR